MDNDNGVHVRLLIMNSQALWAKNHISKLKLLMKHLRSALLCDKQTHMAVFDCQPCVNANCLDEKHHTAGLHALPSPA